MSARKKSGSRKKQTGAAKPVEAAPASPIPAPEPITLEEAAGPSLAEPDPSLAPSGKEVRRATKAATNAHAGDEGVTKLLGDIYYQGISIAIAIGLIFGAAGSLRETFAGDQAAGGPIDDAHTLPLSAVIVLAGVVMLGSMLSLAARLGPVGMGGAQGAWWLPLPIGRRSLLRPAAHRFPWLAGLVMGILITALYVFAGEVNTASAAIVAANGIVFGVAGVYLVGVAQSWWVGRRIVMIFGDALVVIAPALALYWSISGSGPQHVPVPGVVSLAVLVVVAICAGVFQDFRLDKLGVRELRERGAAVEHAAGAAASMDSRELGRALSDTTIKARRRRSLKMRLVRGPRSAIVVSDLLVLFRSPRHLIQLLATAFIPAVFARAGALDQPILVYLAILVSGYAASLATAEGARRAEMSPTLDALMPMDASDTRISRTMTPAIVMFFWSTIAFVGLVWARTGGFALNGANIFLVLLGALTTPVWAGAAIRAAYRRRPNWAGPLVSTPAGAFPPGVTAVFAQGPDIAVLGTIPVGIALVVGGVSETLIWVQIGVSIVAAFWATRTRTVTEWSDAAKQSPEYQATQRR